MFLIYIVSSITLILTLPPLTIASNPLYMSILFLSFLSILLSSFSADPFSYNLFILDDVALLLSYVTFIVIFISYITSFSLRTSFSYLSSMLLLFLSCFAVFSSSSFLLLYVFYESSLLPIIYIILKWGVYPDRDSRALSMLLFTSIFTFPLGVLIFSILLKSSRLHIYFLSFSTLDNVFLSYWIMFRFAVKLPVYGLHFWLPQAHVEAPTFGSIILAGILLKIGSCGLLRLSYFISPSLLTSSYLISCYLMVATVLRSVFCAMQSDFKRLVAYSSVVHMTVLLLLLLTPSPLSYKSILFLSVFHAFSSPSLFLLVGSYYDLFSTRLLLILRGILLATPLLCLFSTLVFILNVPVPPFPSFLAEIFMFFCVFHLTCLSWYFILLLSFLVIVYSLLWYVTSSFGAVVPSSVSQYQSPSLLTYLSFSSYLSPSVTLLLLLSTF